MQRATHRLYAAVAVLATSATWSTAALAEEPAFEASAPAALPPTAVKQTEYPITSPGSEIVQTETVRPNRPLLLGGILLLGGTYAASAIVAATSDEEADEKLYIPVVGPWLDLADRDCDVRRCENETRDTALLIASGVGQGLGALSMLASLFVPENHRTVTIQAASQKIVVGPASVGRSGYGVGAIGTF